MFKKPVALAHRRLVSGADRKKLRKAVQRRLGWSAAALDAVLPAKGGGDAEVAKLPAPSRTVVYFLAGEPVLLDLSGKEDFRPTLFALWRAPCCTAGEAPLVPRVYVKHPDVTAFLLAGADLMLPGTLVESVKALGAFRAGDLVAVHVPGNDQAVALGTMVRGSEELGLAGLVQGARGRLLAAFHHYQDHLYRLGPEAFVPNRGFLADVVLPVDAEGNPVDPDDGAAASASGGEEEEEEEAEGVAAAAELDRLGLAEGEEGDGEGGATREMDDLLSASLLQALRTTVKDKLLPLSLGVLWNKHVLPARPSGTRLDFKLSRYKKLADFLEAKQDEGLLRVKADKWGNDVALVQVDRRHAALTRFKKLAETEAGRAAEASAQESLKTQLQVWQSFRPSAQLREIFEAVGEDPKATYTWEDGQRIVHEYVEREGLVRQDTSVITLTPGLCDALFKGAIKKGQAFPETIREGAELTKAFMARMNRQTSLQRGNRTLVKKGELAPVRIATESRNGGKVVTRVSGFETYLVECEALADDLKKKFACATSVGDLPGKHGGKEVVCAGDLVKHLPQYLVDRYQLPKDKVDAPQRKKKGKKGR